MIRGSGYAEFVVGRLVRLYVPYVVILLICAACALGISDKFAANIIPFLSHRWSDGVVLERLIAELNIFGDINFDYFNNVLWTLVHEARLTFVVPLFLIIMSKYSARAWLSLAIVFAVGADVFSVAVGDESAGFKTSFLFTMHFGFLFVVGAAIARCESKLVAGYLHIPRGRRMLYLLVAMFVYYMSFGLSEVPKYFHFYILTKFGVLIRDYVVCAVCSYFIVALMASGMFFQTGLWACLVKVGKYSFSLYLVHVPIITFSLYLWYKIGVWGL